VFAEFFSVPGSVCVRESAGTERDVEVNFVIKLLSANGECLGASRRRRTQLAAISLGEPQAGFDPGISEWGNPIPVTRDYRGMNS
jgi:hypothetical protein